MYLWQRRATATWLDANEGRLERTAPGALAIIKLPGRERLLLEVACRTEARVSHLKQRFGGAAKQLPRDWQARFLREQIGAPIRIGKRLVIVMTANASDAQNVLVIPAAGAFGTGQHPTTAMSLRLLEETTRGFSLGWRALDAGTGSGILALAARRFGAGAVLALDCDPRALAHARRNARLNHIRNVQFVRQDFRSWKPDETYDIITANLFSELLIEAAPIFRRALRPHGRLILSGILREQASPVLRSLGKSGLCLEQLRRRGKWIALLVRGGNGR